MREVLDGNAYYFETIDTINSTIKSSEDCKTNLNKWILLEDNGEQYQTGIHKNLVRMYRDYDLSNKPLLGYKLFCKTDTYNVFDRDSSQSFYYSPYDSIESMRKSLYLNCEKIIEEVTKQINLQEKE